MLDDESKDYLRNISETATLVRGVLTIGVVVVIVAIFGCCVLMGWVW